MSGFISCHTWMLQGDQSVCVYPCVTMEFTHARQASDDALSLRKTWIILIHVTSGLPLPRHLPHSPVCVFRGCGCVATGGSSPHEVSLSSGTTLAPSLMLWDYKAPAPRLIVCKQTPTKTTFRARGQRLPRTVSHLVLLSHTPPHRRVHHRSIHLVQYTRTHLCCVCDDNMQKVHVKAGRRHSHSRSYLRCFFYSRVAKHTRRHKRHIYHSPE